MTQSRKLMGRILSGKSDSDVNFVELCNLLRRLGFAERVRGSHRISTQAKVEEIINLQPRVQKRKPTR
jgi:hypothetical protein